MENLAPNESKSMIQPMHGLQIEDPNIPSCETPLPKPSNSLKPTPSIPRQPNDPLLMSRIALNSPIWNGRISFRGERSTSTPCSVGNSPLLTTIPKLRNLGISKSLSEQLSQPKPSRTEETGLLPGIEQSELRYSPFPTKFKNSRAMESTLLTSLPSRTPVYTAESLLSTKLLGREWDVSGTSNYQTSRNSLTSKSRTWIRSGYQLSRDL